jgi:hypothetical protein
VLGGLFPGRPGEVAQQPKRMSLVAALAGAPRALERLPGDPSRRVGAAGAV